MCFWGLQVGGVSSQQMAVYEEFARMIPGFLPNGDREQQQQSSILPRPVAVSDLLVGFVLIFITSFFSLF